jgi:RHS repeat-associated protein
MSNKSGTSNQVISTPQGGGALQGIGEKFLPDLHTGTGNFTVPIALPPGRNGFQPQLNLVYSTGSGNGAFGLGWDLSIPGISRQTSKGIPRYDDLQDIFILSGAEDLVLINSEPNLKRYRPRTEGLFARIEHHHDANNNFWQVWSKDGLISFYGTPRPPEAGSDWQDPSVVADPNKRDKIFDWKLSATIDPFGNRIEYEYERNAGEEGSHRWDHLDLKRIRYADFSDRSETKFLVSVTFEYEARTDAFSEYRSGFEMRTRRRCRQIAVRTHTDIEQLVRTYQLTYLDERNDLENLENMLPLNGVSLLSQVKVTGHNGEAQESLPPLEFSYSRFEPKGRKFFSVQGRDLPANSLAHPSLELADLFGNGLPDILEMNGSVRYWRNLGNGKFDRPREMRDAPAGLQLADPGVQMIDANGDGRIDLLTTTDNFAGYFPLKFGGLWDRKSFQRYEFAPSFNLEDPEVRLVDLDGDGVTDAIRSGSRMECFFNHPKRGWHETRLVERQALAVFPNVNFSDPRVKLGDVTGDGLQNILLIHDSKIEYWPNLGYGNWGRKIIMKNSPRFPYGYDPKRILVGDIDGDGLDDIVYIDNQKVTLWINQSGNGWSDPIEIKGTPSVSDIDAVRLVDLLGTGVSGVLWSTDANNLSRSNLFFLDLTGGVKPYLLSEMDNHMGSLTRVGYVPSTQFYLQDEQRPQTRWTTPLPFPVQVVSRVEAIDQISQGKLTSEYRYHHGYWDGAEREFRGFGRVDQRDTEVFADFQTQGLHPEGIFEQVIARSFSPPLETRTWFHQGAIGEEFGDWDESDFSREFYPDDPQVLTRPTAVTNFLRQLPRRAKRDALRTLRGSVLRTELYALDGTADQERPYTVTEPLFGVREESLPSPSEPERLRIFFPHALAQRTTQWERGNDPMTQFTFTDDYDEYGQPRSQTSIAIPRGRDYRASMIAGDPYLATQTVTDFVHRDDAQRYLIGRATRVTGYEIENDGSATVFALHTSIQSGTASRQIIGQSLNFYDGDAFQGLPFGQLGDKAILSRSESLVLTDEILREAYKRGDTVLDPAEVPPYLVPGSAPNWSEEYPQEFRDRLPALAGYIYQPGGADSAYTTGFYAIAERRRYDCQENPDGKGRGLLKATQDPLGREASILYDVYDLLPIEATDPAGLTMQAIYDYRVLQPRQVTDPNGNRLISAFTPLGLVESTAAIGKADETVGDTVEIPGSRLIYDFLAYDRAQQPVSVRTISRVHHANDTDVPLPERDETIESIQYSDGFGRSLQSRTQAEDLAFGNPLFGDAGLSADRSVPVSAAVGQRRSADRPSRVVVSGWQIYDNKGKVVAKFEPFFSVGFDYLPPIDAEFGQKAEMSYDPRGQVIRTVNADGSEQRVILGIPVELSNPDRYIPTPWEAYTYDANDNAGRTHADEATPYSSHWDTPASAVVDALGRTIQAIARNGANPETDWLITRSTYDIRGNLLTVTDALGRVAFQHVYDLANRPLRIESIDAGLRRMVLDAIGNEVERRDSKGALILHAYDLLNRLVRMWASDGINQPVNLRQHLVYGDTPGSGLTTAEAIAANLLGKPYQLYDEAGRVTIASYDFKGNVLEKGRQAIADAAIMTVFDSPPEDWRIQPFQIDWQPQQDRSLEKHASELLDTKIDRTSLSYDALNRVKAMQYPEDVEGQRKVLRPEYNRAGALERVLLDRTPYVEQIAYNAKGQRTLVVYGNGVMTRHAYDAQTFRLVRLRTERFTQPSDLVYQPKGAPLQDFAYRYDLVGNILEIQDRTPASGIPNTLLGIDALDRAFTYDPIYRLLSATGREADRPPELPDWLDRPRGTDATRTRGYTERYQYDVAGNMLQLQHQTQQDSFNRDFALEAINNRLKTVSKGETDFTYTYDVNGNLIQENKSRYFEWNHSDQLRSFRTQAGTSEPSVYAHYLYDAAGERVKKLVRKQGGEIEVTVYIDGLFEYHRTVQGSSTHENNSLHVMDGQSRIALVRVGKPFPDDQTPAVKVHLGDHLGSSNVVVDDAGELINREEYTPYGETSFGSFAKKRYRFTGKERDEESGLNYHSARYYSPWLVRWMSCDPLGPVDGVNLYQYVRSNPIRFNDPTGLSSYDDLRKKVENFNQKVTGAEAGIKKDIFDGESHVVRYQETEKEANIKEKSQLEKAQKKLDNAQKTLGQLEESSSALRQKIIAFEGPNAGTLRGSGLLDELSSAEGTIRDLSTKAGDLKKSISNTKVGFVGRGGGGGGSGSSPSGGNGGGGSPSGGGTIRSPGSSIGDRALKGLFIVGTLVGLYSATKELTKGNYVRAGAEFVGAFVDVVDWALLAYDIADATLPPTIKKYPGVILAPPTPGSLTQAGGFRGKLNFPLGQPQPR